MTSGRAAHCGPTAADASRQQRWPGRDARRVALFLACCLAAVSAPGVVAAQNASSDAATLLAFQAATTNWASATAGQNFIGWTAGTASPCNWTGVQCDTRSRVTSLQLQGLALQGQLPTSLGQLPALQTLNLGSNAFSGPLPVSWGSNGGLQNLSFVDLSKNGLTGSLPSQWGAPGQFPVLSQLSLDTNRFTGQLPSSWGAAGVFTNLSTVALSNNQLTGPLPDSWGENANLPGLQSLDVSANNLSGSLPSVWGHNNSFTLLTNLNLANNTLSGGLPADWANAGRFPALQQLEVQYNQLSGSFPASWGNATHLSKLNALTLAPGNDGLCGSLPTVSYAIKYSSASGLTTNVASNLGACTTACGKLVTTSAEINVYDISVEAGVALRDLLSLNPVIVPDTSLSPGTQLARPCYVSGAPTYFGADIAQGQPAIQSSTTSNLVASLAVSGSNGTGAGQCSQTQDGSSAAPAWWMVDLGVSTDIEGLIVTSGLPMSDLQISIGDQDSPVSNTPCSQGQQIAANTAVAQVCQGHGRYVSLTRASGNTVSLCRVEVFAVAADAASGKNVTVSGGANATAATDGDPTTCAAAVPAQSGAGAWVTVDLGYAAAVATVGISLGAADLVQGVTNLRAGLTAVVNGDENPLCTAALSELPGYSRVLYLCPGTARYITLQSPSAKALDVCTLSVYAQTAPAADMAVSPGSQPFNVAAGPVSAPSQAALQAPALQPVAYVPPQAQVTTVFRLALIGPYVVPFDGKESAVMNAIAQVLSEYTKNVTVLSYTVGAPVAYGPSAAPSSAQVSSSSTGTRRRLLTTDGGRDSGRGAFRRASRQMLVSTGAVVINLQVYTTQANQQPAIRLLQEVVNNGSIISVLNNDGLPAQTVIVSVVPQGTPGSPPTPAPDSGAPGPSASTPGSPAGGGGGTSSPDSGSGSGAPASPGGGSSNAGAIAGGVAGGLVALALLLLLAWYLMRRRRPDTKPKGAVAAVPPSNVVRGKEFIDPESGSDSGSGGSGAKSKSSIPCFPWTKQQQDDSSRPQQGDSPGEVYGGGAIFRDSKQLEQGSAAKAQLPGSRDAFAVAANGSPDSTLLNSMNSNVPLLNPFPPLPPLGLHMVRSDSPASESPMSHGADFLAGDSILELSNLGPGPGLPLMRGVSDVTTDSDVAALGPLGLPASVSDQDIPTARWQATSAGLWPITYSDLRFQKQIGEGSFGRVYLAKWRETTVAVKLLHRQAADHQDEDLPTVRTQRDDPILTALQREAGIMASVRHPNVISYLGICTEPACIVTEYCAKGSLTDVLRRGRSSAAHAMHLDWPKRLNMAMDAAKGMLHLHLCDPPIIHRDLKSPNLLVDKHWRVKVCDFNLSRVMEDSVVLSSMVASNPRWLAPEILGGLPYTVAADVYSFGIIMWELLTWEVPWSEQNTWQVHAMVTVEKLRPDIPPEVDELPGGAFAGLGEYVNLMKACWAQDATARPDFETIIGRLRRLLAVESLAGRGGSGSLKDGGLLPANSMDVRTAAAVAQQNVINSSPAVVGTGQYPGE